MRKKSSLLILFFIISVSPYLNAQDALLIKREDAIDDIKEMFRLIEDAHYNPYLYLEQEKFNTKKDSLIKIILLQKKEIRKNDFLLHCMQFLANLNDAHTSMKWWNAIPQENWEKAIFFEMELTLNENGHIYSSDRKQIVKINDHEIEMLFNEAMKCYGGNYIFRKNFVEKTFFSAYLHLRGIQPPFKILYSTGETEIIDKKIKLDNLISRFTPQNNDYKFELKDNKVGIIYYNNCVNIKSFKKFLKSTFKEIQQNNIDKLIIDIRQNTGGNSALNDLLLSYLTTKEYRQSSTRYWKVSKTQQDFFASNKKIYGNRMVNFFMNQPINSIVKEDEFSPEKPKKNKLLFKGKSCLLIGPATFSSANFLADAISTYDIMPIIGLPTGEFTNDFGEQIELELPKTKLDLTISVAYDIGANGNADISEVVNPDYFVKDSTLKYAIKFLE